MTKQAMLDAIEKAKKTHLEQMHKIEAVINGEHVENPTALSKKECECGVWFYAHENEMKEILGVQLFDRLDKHHEEWHHEYLNIYNLFFKEDKKTGLFSKILGRNKVDTLTLDKACAYFVELQKATQNLLKASESATRRVSALQETKFH